jgi:D-3-phosphoglycerate dehydrogenase / 2-oxoglutarate reductase
LMLALSRKLVVAHDSLKDGWWLLDRKRQAGTQLHGKTLGVVGLGRVGHIVAQRCLALSMSQRHGKLCAYLTSILSPR